MNKITVYTNVENLTYVATLTLQETEIFQQFLESTSLQKMFVIDSQNETIIINKDNVSIVSITPFKE